MTAPRILIAHEEPAIREAATHAAQSAGYDAIAVADGDRALGVLLGSPTPAALVVDVGLPARAGYELIADIARHGLGTRVVLIASVYSKTAYKRKPTTLYGADDYVEQHHIVDMLASKLAALVPAPVPPPLRSVHGAQGLPPDVRRESDHLRAHADERLHVEPGHVDAVARAESLAQVIVADLVLYNGTEVEQWVRDRDRRSGGALPARVLSDLDEARRLFEMAVPRDVAGRRDFVLEALMEFLEHRD